VAGNLPQSRGCPDGGRFASVALIAQGKVARVHQAKWWADFKIFKDRDGRYDRHLEADSGRIIAQSGHPYESKYRCEQEVSWLRATRAWSWSTTTPGRRAG
jgi:uncharacterized protein YegP (UPF0339 family)